MKPTAQRLSRSVITLCATAALLAACGGAGDSDSDGGGSEQYVDGATFTMAMKADPGNLDPQSSAQSALFTVTQLGYDNLVSVDSKTGAIQSQIASDCKVAGKAVTLTRNKDVTCAGGTPFTPTIAADNGAYVGAPKDKSPFLGTFLPRGATAQRDDAAGTLTITLAQPAPFVL